MQMPSTAVSLELSLTDGQRRSKGSSGVAKPKTMFTFTSIMNVIIHHNGRTW